MEEKEYDITIREILQRTVRQKASSREEALEIVEAKYRAEEIVLAAEDFFDHEFGCREVPITKEQKR